MQRLDKDQRISFVDLTQATPMLTCPINKEQMLARFHATTKEGETISGAAAFAAMWREIPLLRPLGLAARNHTVLNLLEKSYIGFLKVRPTLQKIFAQVDNFKPFGKSSTR
jgi:predicted DCC family thiol-disulfide oxidoreductase YuxK